MWLCATTWFLPGVQGCRTSTAHRLLEDCSNPYDPPTKFWQVQFAFFQKFPSRVRSQRGWNPPVGYPILSKLFELSDTLSPTVALLAKLHDSTSAKLTYG